MLLWNPLEKPMMWQDEDASVSDSEKRRKRELAAAEMKVLRTDCASVFAEHERIVAEEAAAAASLINKEKKERQKAEAAAAAAAGR